MARRLIGKYLEVEGGLFNPDGGGSKELINAVADGIKEQGEKAKEIMVGFISAGGFIDSGNYVSGVEATFKRSSPSVVGFSLIETVDDWQHHGKGRPTDTWLARGVRGGKKLRKQDDFFTKTGTRLKDAINYEAIADSIAKALD